MDYKTIKKILILAILSWPILSEAIGRVGNGVVDPKLGFEAKIPLGYFMGQALTDGSFKIAKPSSNASFSKEDYLQYVPLDLTYPELQGLPRDKANLWKAVVGGGVPQEHSDPCVDVHMYESKTLIYGTAQWGVNKGLAIFGPQTSFKKVEILEVLQSLKLMTGACEWN